MSETLGDRVHSLHHPQGAGVQRIRVVAAVVWRGDQILLTQRPPGGPLGLKWEFPGGKIEEGETPEHALVREMREELSVRVVPHETIGVDTHDYPHGLGVEICFVRCTLETEGFVPSSAVHALRWVNPQAVDAGEVLAGDREFLRSLGASG